MANQKKKRERGQQTDRLADRERERERQKVPADHISFPNIGIAVFIATALLRLGCYNHFQSGWIRNAGLTAPCARINLTICKSGSVFIGSFSVGELFPIWRVSVTTCDLRGINQGSATRTTIEFDWKIRLALPRVDIDLILRSKSQTPIAIYALIWCKQRNANQELIKEASVEYSRLELANDGNGRHWLANVSIPWCWRRGTWISRSVIDWNIARAVSIHEGLLARHLPETLRLTTLRYFWRCFESNVSLISFNPDKSSTNTNLARSLLKCYQLSMNHSAMPKHHFDTTWTRPFLWHDQSSSIGSVFDQWLLLTLLDLVFQQRTRANCD